MEFLRIAITEASANTYAEASVETPVSRSEKLAMLVWRIEWHMDRPDLEDGQSNRLRAQLTDRTFTALQVTQSVSILSSQDRTIEQPSQGSLTEYLQLYETPKESTFMFQPPFLYAKSSIFLGVQGTGNSGAKFAVAKLGYTLETVSPEVFIAALVE